MAVLGENGWTTVEQQAKAHRMAAVSTKARNSFGAAEGLVGA